MAFDSSAAAALRPTHGHVRIPDGQGGVGVPCFHDELCARAPSLPA